MHYQQKQLALHVKFLEDTFQILIKMNYMSILNVKSVIYMRGKKMCKVWGWV